MDEKHSFGCAFLILKNMSLKLVPILLLYYLIRIQELYVSKRC
jgi:hypothetical protein